MNKIIIHVVTLLFLSCSVHASVDEAAAERLLSKRKNNSQHSSLKRTKTYEILHTIDNDSSSDQKDGDITFKQYLNRLQYSDFYNALLAEDNNAVGLLIEQGIDVDKKYQDVIPLHLAVSRGDVDLVQLLLAADANPNVQNSDGHSPLRIATAQKSANIVRVLLEHEADANLQDNEGNTPLHIAVENDLVEIAQLLMIANSKTDIKNKQRKTPFDLVLSEEMMAILV